MKRFVLEVLGFIIIFFVGLAWLGRPVLAHIGDAYCAAGGTGQVCLGSNSCTVCVPSGCNWNATGLTTGYCTNGQPVRGASWQCTNSQCRSTTVVSGIDGCLRHTTRTACNGGPASSYRYCCGAGGSPTNTPRPPGPTSPPGPTATPAPSPCTIQGYKVMMPGNVNMLPASNQTVSLNGGGSTTTNPYYFSNIASGTRTVSVSVPSGYVVGYTACTNSTGCHGGALTSGSSWTGTCPAGGYVDLWWHYSVPSLIPNCKNMICPSTIVLGTSGSIRATYEDLYGPVTRRALAIFSSSNLTCSGAATFWQESYGGAATLTYNWTPLAVGTYRADCRAWNSNIAECRGACVDGPPRYACVGPDSSCTITVVAPTPTRTPTPRPPTSTPTTYRSPTPFRSPTPLRTPTLTRTPTPSRTPTPTPTMTTTPVPVHRISGSIYLRNNATETACSEVSGVDIKVNQLDGQLSVSAGGQSVNVGHGGIIGDFLISGIPESSSSLPVTLNGVDTTRYEWVRPAGNTQGVPNICTTPSSPSIFNQDVSNVNWFIRELRFPWWQVIGGDVGAMGGSGVVVESKIPGGYLGSKYIIAQGGGMSQGVVVQGSSVEPQSYGGGITETSDWWANSTFAEPRETYDVLHGYVYNGPGFTESVNCSLTDCSALNQVLVTGNTQYIHVNDDVVLSGGWGVGAGESQTYVVEGDLTIPVNVQVASGGFLAFIVSGSMTIYPGVSTLEGVYVADGLLTTESLGENLDSQLNAQGMFVGWNGVELERDLADDTLIGPAERFTYRPDLIVSAPDAFRRDSYFWEELQP